MSVRWQCIHSHLWAKGGGNSIWYWHPQVYHCQGTSSHRFLKPLEKPSSCSRPILIERLSLCATRCGYLQHLNYTWMGLFVQVKWSRDSNVFTLNSECAALILKGGPIGGTFYFLSLLPHIGLIVKGGLWMDHSPWNLSSCVLDVVMTSGVVYVYSWWLPVLVVTALSLLFSHFFLSFLLSNNYYSTILPHFNYFTVRCNMCLYPFPLCQHRQRCEHSLHPTVKGSYHLLKSDPHAP